MQRIEFDKIFRISPSGIYYSDGKVDFGWLQNYNGFHGEERLGDGEFTITLFTKPETIIVFPFSAFKNECDAVKSARAKCGSCCLFLQGFGVKEKIFININCSINLLATVIFFHLEFF